MPDLLLDPVWIAIVSPDHLTNMAPIAIALPVRRSVVISMVQGLLVCLVHRSIRA
jgi:hypothetical protein